MTDDGSKGESEGEGRGGNRRRFAETVRDERPDLALLCLLIGVEAATAPSVGGDGHGGRRGAQDRTAQPSEGDESQERGVLEAEIELDRLAGLLPYAATRTPEQWARVLEELLGAKLGFRGSPDDYRRLDSSLLQSVLRNRRGLPILLSVVWMEVARRAGAPVYGVALPGHFVVGFGDPSGEHTLADPYNGGRLLSSGDLELLIAGATGARTPVSEAMLRAAGPLEIVLRILNNIRAWAAARPEHSAIALWALELALLVPHHPARLRYEHAQLLVERADFLGGAAEMEEYASVIAAIEPSAAESVRRAARAARARLN
jgi:regulator of sirC expression with transglutaminase-like and TPR domain